MSAAMVSDEIYDVLESGTAEMGPFAHGYTYSAHPLAAAAGVKNLEIIENENLVDNAAEVGKYLQTRLRDAVTDHPLVGEVRGLGLIAGVELVADKKKKIPFEASVGAAKKMYTNLLDEGLICRPINNMLAMSPPLVVNKGDIDQIVERFTRALEKLPSDLGV